MRRALSEDWHKRYRAARVFERAYLEWDDVRHIVIIPNYRESIPILRRTLRSLAQQAGAPRLALLPAMEAHEPGAPPPART